MSTLAPAAQAKRAGHVHQTPLRAPAPPPVRAARTDARTSTSTCAHARTDARTSTSTRAHARTDPRTRTHRHERVVAEQVHVPQVAHAKQADKQAAAQHAGGQEAAQAQPVPQVARKEHAQCIGAKEGQVHCAQQRLWGAGRRGGVGESQRARAWLAGPMRGVGGGGGTRGGGAAAAAAAEACCQRRGMLLMLLQCAGEQAA